MQLNLRIPTDVHALGFVCQVLQFSSCCIISEMFVRDCIMFLCSCGPCRRYEFTKHCYNLLKIFSNVCYKYFDDWNVAQVDLSF